jgi:thiol-disulfide isomerase/thioredoxin
MRKLLATLLCAAALFAAAAPRRAPGFTLPDLKGKMHDLFDYRGKTVILEFMQTTCSHCAAFAPVLNQVAQKYGDKVVILAVVNPPDDQGKVSGYVSGHKVAYPMLFDCGQVAYSYLQTTSFDLPQVFLIDANGMIRSQYVYGPLTRDIFEGGALMGEIDRLLPARAPAAPPKKK